MATNKKISELPAATLPVVTGTKFEALQGGINVQVDADDMPGAAAGVTSVTGTTNRITSSGGATPVIDIDSAYDTAVTNAIAAAVSGLAPIASPTFTGTPAAPTAAPGTNNTQVATTEFVNQNRMLGLAFSDEVTPITAGTDKLTFHWPYTTTFLEIWIELKTAQASGSIFTVDVHKAGTTILSTKLTIDNTEETSLTAVAAPVISVSAVTKGDKMTIDVDQVGNGSAVGGKIWFRG